jgi:hypothetical protein
MVRWLVELKKRIKYRLSIVNRYDCLTNESNRRIVYLDLHINNYFYCRFLNKIDKFIEKIYFILTKVYLN